MTTWVNAHHEFATVAPDLLVGGAQVFKPAASRVRYPEHVRGVFGEGLEPFPAGLLPRQRARVPARFLRDVQYADSPPIRAEHGVDAIGEPSVLKLAISAEHEVVVLYLHYAIAGKHSGEQRAKFLPSLREDLAHRPALVLRDAWRR